MALDHSLVGEAGEPYERSWDSKDALLYAVGVGAGLDPLHELEFTTENSTERYHAAGAADVRACCRHGRRPVPNFGDFDRALLVHAEQTFELHRPLSRRGHGRRRPRS